ncbi:MAG: alpha/beta fold hydrolase, partial [Pseudomonadota bacterium]
PPAGAEAFFPGKDVATRKGKVVFKNALMELIQYEPTTKKVHAEPILITPAWIMKYYILDLSPENSLIGYLIDNGFTVFVISWVNPEADLAGLSFDDYRQLGLGEAVDAVGTITQSPQIHIAGYCLGGTLVAIEAARMARESDARFNSISLLAAQVDFEEAGELTLFINESQITFLEDVMRQTGYLDARQMAGAFQLLRSRDLIWSRMVHHYLMGDPQGLNDLAAWNADATRMPFRMHSEYLRQLFLENELAKGRFEVDGSSVFLEDISAPTFVAATERDHVSPWLSVFKILHLLDTDVTFLLASGGHNGGIVSEPGRENRHFRVATHKVGAVHPDPETWRDLAHYQEGSWWPSWVAWLKTRSSGMHAPPAIGSPERGYPVLGDAPGEYVFQD